MANIDRLLGRIDARSWDDIKSKWLNYLPAFSSPGQKLDAEIYELFDLTQIQKISKDAPDSTYKYEVDDLRSSIFHEGLYLLYKSIHICNAGSIHIDSGLASWSISSGYQASFFAVKSFLCFLGISIPKINMNHLLIDSFPEEEPLSKKKIKQGIKSDPFLKFISLPDINHQNHWEILLRVLRVTTSNIWPSLIVNSISNITPKEFSQVRNQVHYKSSYWFDPQDLFSSKANINFASNKFIFKEILDSEDPDLNFYISYCLIQLSLLLLNDLSELSTIVIDEMGLIKEQLEKNEKLIKSCAS